MLQKTFILVYFLSIPVFIYSATIKVPDDYQTIQNAINAAFEGDTVLVKPGIYFENIDFLGKAIAVRSRGSPEETIIDGGYPTNPNRRSVVIFENREGLDSILKGFTITNGAGTLCKDGFFHGGGIYCFRASPTIEGNIITGNWTPYPEGCGGGIRMLECPGGMIRGNTITLNIANGMAGGIDCQGSSPIIEKNIVTRNICYASGAGINCRLDSSATILNNRIIENMGTRGGGGIRCAHCSPLVANNMIIKNWGSDAGGIHLWDSDATIVGNTLYGNVGFEKGGGNFYCWNGSEPIISNCIIWDGNPNEISISGSSSPAVTYSDIKDGWSGVGNINADPLFVNHQVDDYHLSFDSPCRNAGNNSAVVGLYDFEGDPRMAWGGTVDMGADEFYNHLYCTGDFSPGGIIEGNLVGLPGTSPIFLLFGAGICEPPMPTMWGGCYLEAPILLLELAPIASNGPCLSRIE